MPFEREDLPTVFNALAVLFLRPETPDAEGALDELCSAADLPKPEACGPQTLEREYARLFLGVGPETTPLCESVWTSPLGLVCQDAQLACREAYRAHGMAPSEDVNIPDDHIGVMCAYIALMLEQDDAQAAKTFATEHLARCLPHLKAALEGRADAKLYRSAAAVLERALERLAA